MQKYFYQTAHTTQINLNTKNTIFMAPDRLTIKQAASIDTKSTQFAQFTTIWQIKKSYSKSWFSIIGYTVVKRNNLQKETQVNIKALFFTYHHRRLLLLEHQHILELLVSLPVHFPRYFNSQCIGLRPIFFFNKVIKFLGLIFQDAIDTITECTTLVSFHSTGEGDPKSLQEQNMACRRVCKIPFIFSRFFGSADIEFKSWTATCLRIALRFCQTWSSKYPLFVQMNEGVLFALCPWR